MRNSVYIFYGPQLPISLSVDPLTEQTMTPYQYTYQNPINLVDPTGMSAEDWYDDGNGNLKYNPNLTEANASTVLKGNESYVGKTPSVADNSGSYKLFDDGTFKNVETNKSYSHGQTVVLESGFSIISHASPGRKVYNHITDKMASPLIEGVQVIGYIFKGGLYDIPKMAIEQGRADHLHLEKDMTVLAFQNGKISIKTHENRNMSFEEKKEAFVKPVISTFLFPLELTGSFFGDQVLGESINRVIDNIKQQ